MYHPKYCFILCCLALALSGACRRADRPADLPKLYPCEIVVLSEGKPFPGVKVSFYKSDPAFKWGIGAFTDETGTAKMRTHGKYDGVPEGEYLVTITKEERDKIDVLRNEAGEIISMGSTRAMVGVYSYVDPQFTEQETTSLKINVEKKKTKQEFEVGKNEKKLLRRESAN